MKEFNIVKKINYRFLFLTIYKLFFELMHYGNISLFHLVPSNISDRLGINSEYICEFKKYNLNNHNILGV